MPKGPEDLTSVQANSESERVDPVSALLLGCGACALTNQCGGVCKLCLHCIASSKDEIN